jgi:hypothetical protein
VDTILILWLSTLTIQVKEIRLVPLLDSRHERRLRNSWKKLPNAMWSVLIAIVFVLGIATQTVLASGHSKLTICHAAGQDGTTKFVTLTISENAVYGRKGNAGHFEENGTPRAGHEQDYFGACVTEETPSPSPSPSVIPSPSPSETPVETPEPTPSETPQVPELPNTAME